MKKAKIIFQVLFLLIAVLVLYFSIDILSNTESYLEQLKVSQYRKFPKYVFSTFLALSVIMIIYFFLERWDSLRLKRKAKSLQKENLKLKSKLFDLKEEKEKIDASPALPEPTEAEIIDITPEETDPDEEDE